MAQTYGSQIFGHYYDALGFLMASGIFFWLAINADNLSIDQKAKVPAFLQNKKVCYLIGGLMLCSAVAKAMKWF